MFTTTLKSGLGRGIMEVAGGAGDRWLGHRKMAGREESPDTVLRHTLQIVGSGTLDRATRLVTPGGAMGAQAKACGTRSATESATENRPPAERSTVASRRETCGTSSKSTQRLARVKRWGKSPPLRWRHRGHGKPRVVQGQIGGESRPGSINPSGRLLESRCES